MRTGLRLRRFQWVAQAVTVIVVLFDAALSATGVLTVRQALVLFAVVEIPLMCVVATAFTVTVVTRTRRGDGVRSAMVHALGHSPFLPLIRAEIRGYRALWQAIRGRDCGVESDAIVLRARRGALALWNDGRSDADLAGHRHASRARTGTQEDRGGRSHQRVRR